MFDQIIKPEKITSPEIPPFLVKQPGELPDSLTRAEADNIYNFRRSGLETLRSAISLKFFHQISEKLEKEKQKFAELLLWKDHKQDALSNYSFVLNPYYFEQKFLK
jgi:hypothetical protein